MSENVIFSSSNSVGRIRFARPEKLNAFTPEMYVRIGEILEQAERDDDIRVILMQGDGRAFSAGFDLTIEVADRPAAERRKFLHSVANANRWKIWNSNKLVVAKAHGYCLAGAFELMLPADFCVASTDCVLGEPEVLFGAGPAFFDGALDYFADGGKGDPAARPQFHRGRRRQMGVDYRGRGAGTPGRSGRRVDRKFIEAADHRRADAEIGASIAPTKRAACGHRLTPGPIRCCCWTTCLARRRRISGNRSRYAASNVPWPIANALKLGEKPWSRSAGP